MPTELQDLSETRKADRVKMVRQVRDLCRRHGTRCKVEDPFLGQERAVAVEICPSHGPFLTVDFDGKSTQPNVFVLSWHMHGGQELGGTRRILPGFSPDINSCHERKATDVVRGFPALLELLDNRLGKIRRGEAVESQATVLTLSGAMWGYLLQLYDLRAQESPAREEAPGGHVLRRDTHQDEFMTVGERATYGYAKDLDEGAPDKERRNPMGYYQEHNLQDYYVAQCDGMREGRPVLSTSVVATAMYPERLFAWGEDEFGRPIWRCELLQHLKALGLSSHPGYWDPCQVWHGYDKGYPTFHRALRAGADRGPTWYQAFQLAGKMPENYEWDYIPGTSYATIYISNK